MIILGIDPGTTRIGYGIIKNEHNRLTCLDYGLLDNRGIDRADIFRRTEKSLAALIKKYRPAMVGIEKLFFFKNQKTVMAVSEMRGALLLTIARHHLPIQEFTPLQVKQHVSAYGRADKNQMQRMVRLILNLKEPIKPDDAADALAIAICCTHTILSP